MSTEEPGDGLKIVRDLAKGFSTQAKYSNKVWLALIAAATLAVFPDTDANGMVRLPFSLGLVEAGTYHVVAFLILVVLMISYCQSYATAHLATRVAHDEIAKLRPESRRIEARKFYDLLVASTLARVAPLAQLTGLVRFAAIYYCSLKLVAVAVLFAIPSTAIVVAYIRLGTNTSVTRWIYWLSVLALVVTTVAVLQVLYLEFRHIFRVTKLYWTGQLKSQQI
jgi:hypothetical protein